MALVKPQFEAGRDKVQKGGIVKDEADRLEAVDRVRRFAADSGLEVIGQAESPIKGAKGNVEYFLYMKKAG